MKIRLALIIISITALGALALGPTANAQGEVPIIQMTGTGFGEKIGLVHFDYFTAQRPVTDPANPDYAKFDAPGYYVGPTKQFYISPEDPYYATKGITEPAGDESIVAGISTAPEDCGTSGCLLRGFAWSDTIGWIVLDGKLINESFGTDPGDEEGANDPYKAFDYPRIKKTGAITGFAWNQHTGWIRLSSDNVSGTKAPANRQCVLGETNCPSSDDWGAWLDIMSKPVYSKGVFIGRPLHGFVWSEHLGWIKFGIEATDTFPLNFQAYSKWIPDDSPPAVLASNMAWFAVGVNTGYKPDCASSDSTCTSDPVKIIWRRFAVDPQSDIRKNRSRFNVKLIKADSSALCPDFSPDPSGNVSSVVPSYTNPSNTAETSPELDLIIPSVGNISGSEVGFCKYELTARLENNVGMETFIGDTFLPATRPDARLQEKIVFYVRAGNPFIAQSTLATKVTPSQQTPRVRADGMDFFRYEVGLRDVAGNPILDIHCGAPYVGGPCTQEGGVKICPPDYSASFQYADCPNREVSIYADITNENVFDLTVGADTLPLSPVRVSEFAVGTTGVLIGKTEKFLEVLKDPVKLLYGFEVASYAPSKSYSVITEQDIPEKKFLVDQFIYLVDNVSELPPISSRMADDEDPNSVILDTASKVEAYKIGRTRDIDPAKNGLQFMPPAPNFYNQYFANIGPDPTKNGLITDKDPTGFFKPNNIFFYPPVDTTNPKLTSGTLQGVLSLGLPADMEFNVNNYSPKPIAVGDLGGISIDNILAYKSDSGNPSVALMEAHRIGTIENDNFKDDKQGWSDPIQGWARYELYDGALYSAPGDPANEIDSNETPFLGFYSQSNLEGRDFCYDTDPQSYPLLSCNPPNIIRDDGTYAISGFYSIPQEISPKVDPVSGAKSYPPEDPYMGEIDRSDLELLEMQGTDPANPSVPKFVTKKIRLTPQKFVPVTITDIQIRFLQEIAYRYADQPFFSVYGAKLGSDYEVRDLGIEATGTVAGTQIVTGRKFDTVGTESTKDLQEQIRRNVSGLLTGIPGIGTNASPCKLTGATTVITEFDVSTPVCFSRNAANDTGFRIYEGTPDQTLILGDGVTNMAAPNFRYTVIVKGGANIKIASNLYYDPASTKSSLGFILIAANIGQGANVYISPTPTNVVGTVYAEGSLIGMDDNGDVYYGGGAAKEQELKNQLYWKGSIASRNTIAGAGLKQVPAGITCLAGDTQLECAQRYDLDYLRRFTAVVVKDDPNTTVNEAASSIANNGLFSGGGSCVNGVCAPGSSLLPTTVKIAGGQIDDVNSELATFFIEPDSRTTTLPPPGFTVSGGQESTQVIR